MTKEKMVNIGNDERNIKPKTHAPLKQRKTEDIRCIQIHEKTRVYSQLGKGLKR